MENRIYQNWTPGTTIKILNSGTLTNEWGTSYPVLIVEVVFPSMVHSTSIINPSILAQNSSLFRDAHLEEGTVTELVRKFDTWEEAIPHFKNSTIRISDMKFASRFGGYMAVFKFDFVSD